LMGQWWHCGLSCFNFLFVCYLLYDSFFFSSDMCRCVCMLKLLDTIAYQYLLVKIIVSFPSLTMDKGQKKS
jgi:hypothetical protein